MASASNRWQRLEGLFYEAVELEPAARKTFLDQHCAGDNALRQEVESLLASSDQPLDFLQKSVQDAAQQVVGKPTVLAPGSKFSRYEVVSLLGAGGMGQVYLARDTQLKRNVALKLLAPHLTRDERGLRRFEQEAQAASALNHPNILTLYEFGEWEGTYYIASEYVEGDTLRQLINKGRLSIAEVCDISAQVSGALVAAHERGIVHRDIKPANLMVRKDGIVKLLDFGIAKLNEDTGPVGVIGTLMSISQPGVVMGTVRYMSPEQARGQVVDGRSDLFSLGVVMYEMLTGEAPFQGETASDVMAEILKVEPPALSEAVPGLSPQMEVIVVRALRKSRKERYQTAAEMLTDLQQFRKECEFQQMLQHAGKNPAGPATPQPLPKKPPTAPQPASVDQMTPASGRQNRSSRLLTIFLALILAVALLTVPFLRKRLARSASAGSPRALAVLPFRNLRPDPQTDFLGFSLADAIITKLGYVNALTVRPSSSVDKYRNQIVDPQKAAADLQVGTLLTGSFLRDGDQLRITAQLIDVQPDKILWQDTIDVKYDRLLTVQDTVSQQIIKGLEVSLTPAEQEKLRPEGGVSAPAYELYLHGVDLYSQEDYPGAITMLEKSVAIDPNYASAWAELGRAYTTNASLLFGGRDEYAKAQSAYEKALALNPHLIEARVFMANLLTDTGQVEQAVPLMRQLLAENPTYAEAHWELGYAYRFGGMLQEAAQESERARQNNPSVKLNSSAMNAYLYLGEYDKFLQSLPTSDSVYVLFYRGFGQYYVGEMGQAQRNFDRAYDFDQTLLPAIVGKALSDGIRGERANGLQLLQATETRILEAGVSDAEGMYKVAQAYAVLGDKASAMLMFHRTIEGGFFPYPYFARDPLLNNIRNEPEFGMLMREAQERHEAFRKKFFQ
ncbi:MAG TPA: protein kinase [Candidatus Binatia bacterium]|nr:protein kinase [Candidatus Binatia bacterium]